VSGRRIATAVVAGIAFATSANVEAGERLTLWDLPLRLNVVAMPPAAAFGNFSCGSDGRAPLGRIGSWRDFAACPPEVSGLHEVYFEYDDEAAYIARARNDVVAARGGGTEESAFPVIVSALFDAAGTLRTVRMVTDPRPVERNDAFAANVRPREEHYLLGPYLYERFGIVQQRDCRDLPAGPGETPVFGQFVKTICERNDAAKGLHYRIEQRYLRKPGQSDLDGETGYYTQGQFESQARAEVSVVTAAANRDTP
jgi:hypothetical protein